MNAQRIIQEIEDIVSNEYSKWYIGITEHPTDRKNDHGNPPTWRQWNADTESNARSIEKHFLDKGMKGDTGGGTTPTYVYIY